MLEPITKNQALLFLLGALAFSGATPAVSDDSAQTVLSPLALFHRCYAHLTQTRLPAGHALRKDVLEGRKSAVDSCMSVLDGARLQSSGSLEGYLTTETPESASVLKTLNGFHRTWFPNDDLIQSITFGREYFFRTQDLHDGSEAALHVTRALLTDGVKYSAVATLDSALEALRSGGAKTDEGQPAETRLISAVSPGNLSSTVFLQAELVQVGELRGARQIKLNPAKQGQEGNTGDTARLGSASTPVAKVTTPIKIHESLGGGIIGTKSYLLLNSGRPDNQTSDGGLKMQRRWAKAVMSDLLCRTLPAVRTSDATLYVQKEGTSSTPPFRGNANCMACHSTMDPMAATARNTSLAFIPSWSITPGTSTAQIAVWPVALPREAGQVDADASFFERPPHGRLFYRSYDGRLVRREVNGIPELGQAIAETGDFYVCAASRYYQFFTGIQVNLQDIGDPANPALSAQELAYRDEVIKLGLDLKSHQSLRTLIRRILESDVYRSSSMRRYGEVTDGGNGP